MRKAETQGSNAVEMTASVLLGGLLALGVELIILLLGSIAVANGILKDSVGIQLTVVACVVGCLAGGRLACMRWPSHRLLAGLAGGGVCFLLLLIVGLTTSESFELGVQGLIELAACLCGGAIAGMFGGKKKKKKRRAARP